MGFVVEVWSPVFHGGGNGEGTFATVACPLHVLRRQLEALGESSLLDVVGALAEASCGQSVER